ncbi:MAG: ATP-binding protein [Chloroflexota bacterium]
MTKTLNPQEKVLKEASLLTSACWACFLNADGSEWSILLDSGMPAKKKMALTKYLGRASSKHWFSNAIASLRVRSRIVPEDAGLGCGRLYLFPDLTLQGGVLVGARILSLDSKRLWGALAQSNTLQGGPSEIAPLLSLDEDLSASMAYGLSKALEGILKSLERVISFQGSWIAVREGDYLRIESQMRCSECQEKRISIEANPLIRKIIQGRVPLVIDHGHPDWGMVPRMGLDKETSTWAVIPLVVGRRLIGLVSFWRDSSIPDHEWRAVITRVQKISPRVEELITFSNLADHLRRLGLLNDFARTISSALELEQIAQRVFALLGRAFRTEYINLLVLTTDGSTLNHYREDDGSLVLQARPTADWQIYDSLQSGKILRLPEISTSSEYIPFLSGARSALIAPLRSRRQVVGALALESFQAEAFTLYDEHLLVIIASHLAGLIENSRLRQEAEARARNLGLIHQVVQQVIGQTDIHKAAQIAAELMARNFAYDLAVVAIAEGPDRTLRPTGIGGSVANVVKRELQNLDIVGGITSQVFSTGNSRLVNDVGKDPHYVSLRGWDANSEMCVALRDGDVILGVVDVESRSKYSFTQNDLLVLESLAGILSSVFSNIGQYQKLQEIVHQLQIARQELQERITAQRNAESRLLQAAKLAAVGEMAAGVAHELNNPLTTVAGFSELILEDLPRESAIRSDMEMIMREAHRARTVVRRLLDFSRQSDSVRARASINEIVTDVLGLINHLLHTSGIDVFLDLPVKLPWVSVDRNQIKQVILNLIHNALYAMPSGGELHISTRVQKSDNQDWLTIAVRDSGVGIPRENLDRVFEPFFTTRGREGGTGLGLSVSYSIVAEHGGYIDVESLSGNGSTFTVWIPNEADE